MDRANDIFDQIDTDKSGGLDKVEISKHLLALGQEQETVMEMFALLDADNDGLISREEFVNGFQKYQEFCKLSAKRMAQGLDLDLRLDVVHGLEPHDFTGLWHQKLGAHLPGTREWAFKEVFAWLDAAPTDAAQLFWLMGGGGVGKSVLTAELLHRTFRSNRVVAWHFCRHDNPQQSSPDALLRSLAAMLCARLPGYKDALGEVALELLKATDPKELFAALFTAPLRKVKSPAKPSFIILDALDELPKQGQKPLLSVITAQLSTLPPWLRLFVTSREEPQIKAALAKFTPKELRADEAKNRTDVEVYLRSIARMHVQGEVNAADIEKDVKREFGIDLTGKLAELQEPMDKSRAIYGKAVAALEGTNGYKKVLAIPDDRPEVRQANDDFNVVYAQAEAARDLLRNALADEWFVDEERKRLGKTDFYYPVPAQKRAWVDQAIDPGIKGEPRSREKMKNDYDGHANLLKDLARITLKYESCDRMATAIKELKKAGFALVVSKNKYLSPTPMGYCDLNFIVELKLKDGTPYLAEVQVNHVAMLEAKSEAHTHYEVVRRRLPELCTGSGVDPGVLEAFIVGRLNSSALDAAVAALSAKADGLFLYAHLLAQHLDTEAKAGRAINFAGLDALPTGLDEVYAVNFHRAFPKGAEDAAWTAARPLIELIAAAREPITQAMAAALLGWDAAQQERVLEATALLFPVRDGKFHVFHKTVVDWLTGDITADSSLKSRSDIFRVERRHGHATLATGFVAWLGGPRSGEDASYWLQHGIMHLSRAEGRAAEAATVYATDLAFLRERLDAGYFSVLGKDSVGLREAAARGEAVDLSDAEQMKAFVGKHSSVLQHQQGAAVSQLASQEPDDSAVFRAWVAEGLGGVLTWRNKPQARDPCLASLVHTWRGEGGVFVAVSRTRIVGGAGKVVAVYDRETEELLEEFAGSSDVKSVAIWENAQDESGRGWIAAGFLNGKIIVWDAASLELKADKQSAHSNAVNSVAFSPDGKTIVSGADDKMIKVWDAVNFRPFNASEWEEVDISGMPKAKNGSVLIEGLGEIKQNYWRNTVTSHKQREPSTAASLELKAEKQSAHSGDVTSVAFSPDGKTIVSGCSNNTLKVWDAVNFRPFNASEWEEVDISGMRKDSCGQVRIKDLGIVKANYWRNTATSHKQKGKPSTTASLELKAEKQSTHSTRVTSVAFSPDGATIVTGSWDETIQIKVWDAAFLELKAEIKHSGSVHSVAFSPDGKTILAGSRDKTLKVWDAASLELKAERQSAHSGWVTSVAFSPDGKTIFSGSTDKTTKVWDAASLELKAETQSAHSDYVYSVAFSPDGKTIVSGSNDKTLKVWDAASMELKADKQSAHSNAVHSVAFSPDGKTIVSGADDKMIKVWDAVNFRPFNASEWEEVDISGMPKAKNGCVEIEGLGMIEQNYWRNTVTSHKQREEPSTAASLELKAEKQSTHSTRVPSVAFSPDGKTIVSGSHDKTIKVWDAASLELKAEKQSAHRSDVNSVAFSPDGKTIVSGSNDKTLKVWDAVNFRPFNASEWEEVDISGMPKAKNGSVSIEGLGEIKQNYWRNTVTSHKQREEPSTAASLELKAEKQSAHRSDVTSVAFSPDGKTIVSGSRYDNNNTMKVWDAVNFRPFNASEWEEMDISGMPKGSYGYVEIEGLGRVKANYWRNTVTSHKLEEKPSTAFLELKAEIKHDSFPMAFSPDGKTIVTGSSDKTLKVWDADTLQHVEERKGDGSALDAPGSVAVAERDGATLRLKEGGSVFYAPGTLGTLVSVAVHWPRLIAGTSSGELYHLEVQG